MLYSDKIVLLKSTDNALIASIQCRQINICTARKLYEKGVKIWLHPCNLTLNNMWQVPYHYQKSETCTSNFDSLILSFTNYNCDKERGKRVIFFAECDSQKKLKYHKIDKINKC